MVHVLLRNAWRFAPQRIHVVDFQSFNSYLADSIGCTTYSFAVNLGCWVSGIPNYLGEDVIKKADGLLIPEEYECWLRRGLTKSVRQKELARRSVWYVGEAGTHLPAVMADVHSAIERDALSWFARFDAIEEVL